jgi:Collagen triple helix repeat (20 copies)
MPRLFTRAGRRLAVVAVLALVGAGIAYATIPDSSGVIHGCYSAKNGSLRVIDSSAKCTSGELALNWNQQGPKGDTGATGPQGLKGDTGVTGPAGPQGTQGTKGDTGATGPAGQQGPKGDTGAVGPQGPQGLKGDAGPQGTSGIVSSGRSNGMVQSPLDKTIWADFRFAGQPAHVTLNSGDLVSVTASAIFGTKQVLGAKDLHLGICYKNPAATGYLRLGDQQDFFAPGTALTAEQNKALPITLSMIFPAGTGDTDVGLCYQTTEGPNWDQNGSLWVSAIAIHS